MTDEVNVLDHGYVRRIETWGSDERIIEAARMSTGKGFKGWTAKHSPECKTHTGDQALHIGSTCCVGVPGDEQLLRFLWKNKHATPFEMAGGIFEIKAPIFVFREWHRHRTQSFNEMSARYTPLPAEDYIPSVERLMMGSDGKNKQAGTAVGALPLTVVEAEKFRAFLRASYDAAERGYQEALAQGVPKELARVHLPVARYSRMRASANLRNWLAFLALRSSAKNPAAQREIRQFADALGSMLAESFPRTMALFSEGETK